MKKSEIHFTVALDDQKVPEAISWNATDTGDKTHYAKAIAISVWDREQPGTMKIDLWTKDMPVEEMKYFYIDTIGALSQSLANATGDKVMAKKMDTLCRELYEHVKAEQDKQEKQQGS